VPRVTEKRRESVPPPAAQAEEATDKLFEPPVHTPSPSESPPTPESTNRGWDRDRGRSIALATIGGLVVLGLVLIVRGPPATPPPNEPAAVLTSAEVPSLTVPLADAAVGSATANAGADASAAAPRFVPAWRVSSLDHDPAIEILHGTLGKHSLAGALAQTGLAKNEIRRVTRAVDGIHRIEHGAAKDSFSVARDRTKGTITAFEFVASPTDVWQAKSEPEGDTLTVKKLDLFVERKRTTSALLVTADLAKAIAAAGLREEAIEEIDDALEGRGDTAVVKPGVRLKVVSDEEWVEGAFARVRVDAVELVPKTGSELRVYFYERDASASGNPRHTPRPGFYDAKGQQPFQGTFRSPLLVARITSRFNPKRMHPVLHTVMPHNGVDFGASTGTPVYASATGTVHSAGDSGPCGNMVQIEHENGLSTAYCHLSRFAPGLHAGQHVDARQLVGFVGQTGRATGPHLHFAVKRGGNFIDPMVLKMDGVRTLPSSDRDAFAQRRAELDSALEGTGLPSADGVVTTDDKDDKDEPAGEE
jgi:murein DD-endopeptidase MepM/ murein hydrolase activator NlpD